jgi:hypothetical protein
MAPQGNNARKGSAALEEVRETPLERIGGTAVDCDGESVDGAVVHVGKLGLNQLVALARIAGEAIAKGRREEFRRAAQRASDGAGATADDVVTLLSVLDEATICALVGTIIQRDEAWVGVHVDALALVEIIDALLEHNKWGQIQQALFRLGRRFQNAQT